MLNTRQTELLKLIVEMYIKSAKPISSKILCESLNCSSATVRAEMSNLEEMGILEKTHTSSGRIPSEKGYRYYVDYIMSPKELNGEDMLKLQTIFSSNSLILTDAISKSLEIVSELTNYTAVVLGESSVQNRITKIEVVPIEKDKLIAIVVTDKGHVEHRHMYIEAKVDIKEVKQAVDLINKMLIGTLIDEVPSKLEFEVKPVIGNYVKQHEALYSAFYNAFSDFKTEADVKVSGRSKMLMSPEFNDVDKIRMIASKFDDKDMIKSIKEDETGVNIYIGSENSFDEDLTVIKTKYNVNGEEGTIAIIGPKRMEYDRVTTLLDFIKKNIER